MVAWVEKNTPHDWDDPSPEATKRRNEAQAAVRRRWVHLAKGMGIEIPKSEIDAQIEELAHFLGVSLA